MCLQHFGGDHGEHLAGVAEAGRDGVTSWVGGQKSHRATQHTEAPVRIENVRNTGG
jgi:hypothetical protein